MQKYLDLVKYVLDFGAIKENSTYVRGMQINGVRTLSTFGYAYHIDLNDGFPLLTTKKIDFSSICLELLWFLSGTNDLTFLKERGCNFWNPWEIEGNKTATQYHYWTKFPKENGFMDQIQWIIKELKNNPDSRRLIVTPWYPPEALENESKVKGHLPPCHLLMQFNVQYNKNNEKELNLMFMSRSLDVAIGCGYNIASYSLLLSIISHITGIKAGKVFHSIVDVHIYIGKKDNDEKDHRPNIYKQLERIPGKLPTLELSDKLSTYEGLQDLIHGNYTREEILNNFILKDYQPQGFLKFAAIV